MKRVFFSADIDIIDEWKKRDVDHEEFSCYDLHTLEAVLKQHKSDEVIVIVDYDSVAQELNKLITADELPIKTIVLEKIPEIASGKMLIGHGVKGYGNSRMLEIHYEQMIETVSKGNIWTYPELTAALATQQEKISKEAKELLEHRLTAKEQEVVYAIIEGLTNEAIAHKVGVTVRTVKAHISSIFQKLHINDRVSLVLLLK